MTDDGSLPVPQRSDAADPVLCPGGPELTSRMLAAAGITGADVVHLARASARTSRDIVALGPKSYLGVDDDPASTGLPDGTVDVVVGEAVLTMRGEEAKKAILAEALRILRPGGRCAVHELGLTPDTLAPDTRDAIRRDLARAQKVNLRPLTVAEWTELLTAAGFRVADVDRAPTALAQPVRVHADVGFLGALRIAGHLVLRGAARHRVFYLRHTGGEHRSHLTAVGIVAVKPAPACHDE
ncbi:methyltransferase [Mycolicibacterium litorale]|uniref:Methyltransferase n=1 Tax=Mycolicibacterium litorale TaxID=758802 RepID=A0A6S6P8C1_9MYCO|nr:class I SAM-dependent methyltransferase [Mycolicibacterium litorale]BCI54765.1 methyltransferase [Mycolicibacterium litorale]